MSSVLSIAGRSPAATRAATASAVYEGKRGRPSFAIRDLIGMAEAICREREWGDNPGITAGLDRFLQAVESEARLDALGRKMLHQDIVRWLCNWLRLQADLRNDDRISMTPIDRPVFIVGFARTGSTLLHALLDLDEDNRTPKLWELLQPHPSPGKDHDADSRRIAAAERAVRQIREFSPDVLKIHRVDACAPDECHYLLEQMFVSPHFYLYFNVPSYFAWLEAGTRNEPEAIYRCYRKQIQSLLAYDRRRRWVGKALAHQYFFPQLIKEFSDACIVRLHREPGAVISSHCSLLANFRSIYARTVDPGELGETVLQVALIGARQTVAVDQTETGDVLFCDVFFEEILRDPVAVVKKIYHAFGFEIKEEYVQRLTRYVAANPRDKESVHRHQLADFGLSQDRIDAEFREYNDWTNSKRSTVPKI